MSDVVFVRFKGGPLDSHHHFYERNERDPWPPPRYAWFVRTGQGYNVYEPTPEGTRPAVLAHLVVPRYRRVSSTVPDEKLPEHSNVVHGALYEYDPE